MSKNKDYKFGEIEIKNNNIYNLDGVDLFADVHIGRLPCINIQEVEIVVDKILNYENIAYDQLWFNTIILAGGDTFESRKRDRNLPGGKLDRGQAFRLILARIISAFLPIDLTHSTI